MPSHCKAKNCAKNASYCVAGTKTRIYCAAHRKPDMVNPRVDNRSCKHPDHGPDYPAPRASFNFFGQKPLYCKAHSEEGMINIHVVKNMCKKCGLKQPSYGLPGQRATHCSKCSTSDMVDRVSRLCQAKSCLKNVTRAFPGEKPSYCKTHAIEGMIDVKNSKCIICKKLGITKPKQPTYGLGKIATHCKEHRTENMTDLKHINILCEKCTIRATYGIPGQKPTRCATHKKRGMKDVTSLMCVKCGKKQGVFGITKTELFCKKCKTKDMKNVKAKMCDKCGLKQPVFNYKGKKTGKYCNTCKNDRMIDVVNFRCVSCQLYIVPRKTQKCSYCSPKSRRRQKTREMIVVNFLKNNNIKFIHNKSVGFICGNYRPDIRIDTGTHIVIVEIDENQHKQYDSSCEIARMANIYQADGMRCVFLRYNPDKFMHNGDNVDISDKKRLDILLSQVHHHSDNIPTEELTVYRMFYDNPEGAYVKKYDIKSELKNILKSYAKKYTYYQDIQDDGSVIMTPYNPPEIIIAEDSPR